MIVAPERETPGIIATAWQRPICSAVAAGSRSTAWWRGSGRMRSISRMAKPPRTSVVTTTQGLNSTLLMKPWANAPDHHRRDEAEQDVARRSGPGPDR